MGSKKKKAAAKRKQKNAASASTTSNIQSPPNNSPPQELEGETTSTTIPQDENHDELIVGKKDSSVSVGLSNFENKPMLEGSGNGGDNPSESKSDVIEIVRDLKTDGGDESGTVSIEYVESPKKSSVSGSSSDTDSSSDKESKLVEKTHSSEIEESELFKKNVKDYNSIDEVVSVVDSSVDNAPLVDRFEKTISLVDDVKTQVVPVTELEKVEDVKSIDSPSDIQHLNANNGGENHKETEIAESSEKQQQKQVTIVPAAEPTSWKSCCGLFELLSGSHRR